MEIREIVEQARRRNSFAFDRLVEAHRDMALGYARTLVIDEQLAEDAVQEALVVAHTKLDRLLDSEAFGAWLRGIVRRRCMHQVGRPPLPSLDELGESSDITGAESELFDRIDFSGLYEAIAQLPESQRIVLGLHYEEGLSHEQISSRLGVTKAAVNMRLHSARSRLRRRLITMNESIPAVSNTGQVELAEGALVTLRFAQSEAPRVFSRLASDRDSLCVVRHVPGGRVQAVSTRAGAIWTPGQEVQNSGEPFVGGLADSVVETLITRSTVTTESLRTGIKTVDIFAPMVTGGRTGVFAEWGVGTLVLLPELVRRLEHPTSRQIIFAFIPPIKDERQWGEVTAEIGQESRTVDVFYIPVNDPISRSFIDRMDGLETKLVLSRTLAEQGIWPSIDPLRSTSQAGDARESEVADGVRSLIRRYYALQFSVGPEATRSLSSEDWQAVCRARLALAFLGQPFFVAEPYTGQPGADADPVVAAQAFADILAGKYDDRNKVSFTQVGDTPKAC